MFMESTWTLQLVDGFKLESAAWWLWSLAKSQPFLSFLATGLFSTGFIGLYWPHGQMHVVFVASVHWVSSCVWPQLFLWYQKQFPNFLLLLPSKRLNTRTENVNVFLAVLLFNVLKSFCIWSNDFLKKLLNLTLVPWLSSPPPCVNAYFYMRVVLILQWSSLNMQSLFHSDCLYDWVWSANYSCVEGVSRGNGS